jgi:hypothetical protein
MKLANDTDVLLDAFGLTKTIASDTINSWTTATSTLTDIETYLLDTIHAKSMYHVSGWNKEEVKMKLISMLFFIADIEVESKLNTFFERELAANINGKELSVVCDCLVATPLGFSTPRAPYFFLQEFKRRKKSSNDPEGQMLAAMLIAQHKNNDNKPIYGAWLTGSIWEFAILDGTTLHSSNAFNTVQKNDTRQIVFILRKLKELILKSLKY